MEDAQESTITKAKELSVKEMMTEITTVREKVETELKTSVTIIKEGLKEEEEKRVTSKQKMEAKIEALKKQVDSNKEVTDKTKADQEQLNNAVDLLVESVEKSEEDHIKATEELEELNGMIEKVVGVMDAQKGKFPSKEDILKLEGAVTKVSAKVVSVDERITKETEVREASVIALEEQVFANVVFLVELEGVIGEMQEDI